MNNFFKTILFALCLALPGLAIAAHLSPNLQISAKMTGDQEVPAVTTSAVGVASLMINETRDNICVNISVNGLSGPITGIHIHEGAPGANGGVIVNLTAFRSQNRLTTSISGAALTPALLEKLLNGDTYLNVHTALNPGGEIRGQLTLESDFRYAGWLDGSQEVPAVTGSAYGLAVFDVAKHKGKMRFNVVINDLTGPITGAHLHMAAAGANGAVIENLTTMVLGNTIKGTVDPTAYITDLEAGNVYLNIHTAANPNGEIRAQLSVESGVMTFESDIDGDQEVPAVVTTAKGVASVSLSNDFSTMTYDIVATGMSGAITGVHFHEGELAANGTVAIDLSADIDGNKIRGMITGAALTPALINSFLTGGMYLNLHTAANAGGEIRGQVYRLAREGYTMSIDAAQEVPVVMEDGMGGGLVTIDRRRTNAHIMIVTHNQTGTMSGVHFHNSAFGANGPVIFNMTGVAPGVGPRESVFTYWKEDNMSTPFLPANEVMFRDNMVYLNLHTAKNPNGELRGQVQRGTVCYNLPTSLFDTRDAQLTIKAYPTVLTSGAALNISFPSNLPTQDWNVRLVNTSGQQVYQSVMQNTGSDVKVVLPALASGIYSLIVTSTENAGQFGSAKVVIR